MDTQQAHGHRHQQPADNGPMFKRRREHGSWRLTADGLDHDAALAVLHQRRPSIGAWPGCRVGSNGSIALNVPGRSQNAKFRGRLHQDPHPHGTGHTLLVSGVMMETMSGIMLPLLFGFVTLLMLGIFVVGALTAVIPPLIIGLLAAPVMGFMAVYFRRGRGQGYDHDSRRLYSDLHKLLSPLHPEPLADSHDLRHS